MCQRMVFVAGVLLLTVAVGSALAGAVVDLKVDIGTDQLHDVKPGWTEWAEPREDPGPPQADETFGDITVILDVNTHGEEDVGLGFRDPDATWPDDPDVYDGPPLVGDGVIVDNMDDPEKYNEMYMTIVGLAAGDYTMTTWHNYVYDWPSESMDIYVDDELKVEGVQATAVVATDEEATTATFDFTVPGGANVVILFISQQLQRNIIVNAFHLVSHATARNPNPADGYQNMCPDGSLSWTAGEFAQDVNGHDVYFGDDWNDVNDANTTVTLGVYEGRQSETEYNPDGTLEMGKTYYWRIDEVNDTDANSPLKGRVWSFKVNEGEAFEPEPRDAAEAVSVSTVLEWKGCLANSYDVYLGTDFNDINDVNSSNIGSYPDVDYNNVDVNLFDPCDYDSNGLEHGTTYYWRVDAIGDSNEWRGTLWSFTTAAYIFDPNLLLWFKFDETSGRDVHDSSGHGHHGTGDDFDEYTWDPNDGRYPGCIYFDGGRRIDLAWSILNDLSGEITVTVWIKGAMGDENWVLSAGDDSNNVWVLLPTEDLRDVEWRAGNDTNDVLLWREAEPASWTEDWHLFGFVKDEGAGTMSIYFDGALAKSKTGVSRTLSYVGDKWFKIGARWDESGGFDGRLDDLMVYDRALSDSEIAAVFRAGNLGSAWGPSPHDGQVDLPYDVNLSWRPGDYVNDVNGHHLYIGTDFDEVNDANSTSHPNVDYYNVSDTNYDPGLLVLGQTYYWRVDEANDPCTWKGTVWRFTVAEFLIIDDMEEYTESYAVYPISDDEEPYGWDSIYTNGTGALLSLVTPTSISWIPAHESEQAMAYIYYNNDSYYSEISNHFTMDPCDWTTFDRRILTLWFYGDPLNDPYGPLQQMYVGIEDSSSNFAQVGYGDAEDEDMNDVRLEEWQEWNIPLSSFTDNNPSLTLTNIETLYIGFGDRTNSSELGSEGAVYFDDIRLYSYRCLPSKAQPDLDWDNDCIVSWGEIEIMAREWLETDVNLGEVKEPCDANLLGWWKLDEGSGSTAADSSSNNNPGTLQILDVNVSWVVGYDGNALEFDGGRVRVPDAPELRPLHQVSVCAWINSSEEQDSSRVVVKGPDNKETFALEVDDDDDLTFVVRDGNDPNRSDYPSYDADSNDDMVDRYEWVHIAGTYDGNSVKCYVNGQLAGEEPNAGTLEYMSQDTNDLAIGNRSDDDGSGFRGAVDDVRIYDYALSAQEVGYLATGGDEIFTVHSIANLVNDEPLGERVVNWRDFDALADAWLDQELWP